MLEVSLNISTPLEFDVVDSIDRLARNKRYHAESDKVWIPYYDALLKEFALKLSNIIEDFHLE